jgi:hypothetical protein
LAAADDEVVADVLPLMLPDELPEAPLPVVLPLGLELEPELALGLALPVEDDPAEPDIAVLSLACPVTLSLQCVAAEMLEDRLALGEELGEELDWAAAGRILAPANAVASRMVLMFIRSTPWVAPPTNE